MGTRIEKLEEKSLIAQEMDRFDTKQEVSINHPGKWVAFKRFVTTMASKTYGDKNNNKQRQEDIVVLRPPSF